MVLTGAHAFAVNIFLKTGEFVIATVRAYCIHFMLHQNDDVLDRKLMLLQVENSIQNSIIST